jgi:uncharacterized protein YjbJ (UPF0337 family)
MSSGTSAPAGGQAGDGARETAQDVAGQAQEKAQEVVGQAQEKAQGAVSQATSRVREQVDQRSSDLGQRASTTAEDLRGVAEHLRSEGKDQPAQLAEKAAERVEEVGGYLQRSDGERILGDIEDFGRQRPWAVVAGGLALGFAASRFLKASSRGRYQAASEDRYESYRAPDTATSLYGTAGAGLATGTGALPPTRRDVRPPGI